MGGKSKFTCQSFNLICNHRQRILYTRAGYTPRWNDRIVILFDDLARDLANDTIMKYNIFVLYDYDHLGEMIEVNYCGDWLIVDNGYLDWSVTIPPMKEKMYYNET